MVLSLRELKRGASGRSVMAGGIPLGLSPTSLGSALAPAFFLFVLPSATAVGPAKSAGDIPSACNSLLLFIFIRASYDEPSWSGGGFPPEYRRVALDSGPAQ